jgi:hypothetical protein
MFLTLFGFIAVEYAIEGQYFEFDGFVEWRIQGAFGGGYRNIPHLGKFSALINSGNFRLSSKFVSPRSCVLYF